MNLTEIWNVNDEFSRTARDRLSRYVFSVNWAELNLKHFTKAYFTVGEMNIMPLSDREKNLWNAYQAGVSKPVDEMNDAEINEFINLREATIFQAKAEQAYAQSVAATRYQKNKKAHSELFSENESELKSSGSYRAEKMAEKKAAKKTPVSIFGNADMSEIMAKLKASAKEKK